MAAVQKTPLSPGYLLKEMSAVMGSAIIFVPTELEIIKSDQNRFLKHITQSLEDMIQGSKKTVGSKWNIVCV